MHKAVNSVVTAAFLLVLSGCPLVNSFAIRVVNNASDIVVTKVRLRNFEAQESVTGNLLDNEVAAGSMPWLWVPLDEVDGADMVKVTVESTNPNVPLEFSVGRLIDGGFAAGKTVTVTVEGSSTQSVDVQIEPTDNSEKMAEGV